MKKYLTLSIVIWLFSNFLLFDDCDYPPVNYLYTKQASYYCHQYTKAALIKGWVNLATGVPTGNESSFVNITGNIHDDLDFIEVCSISDAGAVLPCPGGDPAYHSAIKLNNGLFASTPVASDPNIYTHQSQTAFTTACPENVRYFAAIPNVMISGSSGVNQGMNITLTLTNNGQSFPSYVELNANKWSFNSTYFMVAPNTTTTSTQITLQAKNVAGTSDVTYNLTTACSGSGNHMETKSVQVVPNCTGTLNGGQLNTFNSVPGGPNYVVMALSSWTWVKTSGTASYSVTNGGKNMTFTLSSGCSTFNAYNSSCNLTLIFCKSSSFSSFSVVDMKTLKVVKEGTIEDTAEPSTVLEGLPVGTYVVKANGKSTKYHKSE